MGWRRPGALRLRGTLVAVSLAAAIGLAGLGAAAGSDKGLQLTVREGTKTGNALREADADCPAGRKVVGAGGSIKYYAKRGAVVLTTVRPVPSGWIGVQAIGWELDSGADRPGEWAARAAAICASVPGNWGFEVVSARSASDSSATKTTTATCPSGTSLLGGGGQASLSQSGYAKVLLTKIAPSAQAVVAGGAETGGGTSGNWYVEAYALCADSDLHPAGYRVTGVSDSNSPKSTTVSCPTGKKLSGVGASIDAPGVPAGRIGLHAIAPSQALTSVTVTAGELGSGTTANWKVAATAICVTP